jgi:hypothetical protein
LLTASEAAAYTPATPVSEDTPVEQSVTDSVLTIQELSDLELEMVVGGKEKLQQFWQDLKDIWKKIFGNDDDQTPPWGGGSALLRKRTEFNRPTNPGSRSGSSGGSSSSTRSIAPLNLAPARAAVGRLQGSLGS